MTDRVPADHDLIASAHRLADLPVGPGGIDALAPLVEGIWALLDGLHGPNLLEAPLAATFSAGWSDDDD